MGFFFMDDNLEIIFNKPIMIHNKIYNCQF